MKMDLFEPIMIFKIFIVSVLVITGISIVALGWLIYWTWHAFKSIWKRNEERMY